MNKLSSLNTCQLTIQSGTYFKKLQLLNNQTVTIGRSRRATVQLDDTGLSQLHCKIFQKEIVYLEEIKSKNGVFLNNQKIGTTPYQLKNHDQIRCGQQTIIRVSIFQRETNTPSSRSGWLYFIFGGIIVFCVFLLILLKKQASDRPSFQALVSSVELTNSPGENTSPLPTTKDPKDRLDPISNTEVSVNLDRSQRTTGHSLLPTYPFHPMNESIQSTLPTLPTAGPGSRPGSRKLYLELSKAQQCEYISSQAQRVSRMIGNRDALIDDDVVLIIKKFVDGYAQRAQAGNSRVWGESIESIYRRAAQNYTSIIIRNFRSKNIPPVIGLYLAMIESEYHTCLISPVGAKGMFQFMPETARGFGLDPSDRCDVEKSSLAAAAYMQQRLTQFGPDATSVCLAIAGYNRGPGSVMRDLDTIQRTTKDIRDRSFWSLVKESNRLDKYFQGENIKYVPKFYAAAILGENPWDFGISLYPLSTYE